MIGLAAVLSGLGVYLALFYATRLPSIEGALGTAFPRVTFFFYLLRPEDLVGQWLGTPAQFSIADRLPVLAFAAVILAVAFGLGWLLMTAFRADRGLTRLETFVFAAAVGLNAVSTFVLLVGLAGLLKHVWVFAVPAALTLVAAGYMRRRRKATSPDRKDDQARGPTGKDGNGQATHPRTDPGLSPRWLWLGAPFAVVILLGGMLPPIEFDVREYHLQVPKEFFGQGFVGFLPHNVYGNMPMGTEMLSLLAMVLTGDWWFGALVGKTVIAAFAPLTALGLFAAGRRLYSTSAGVVAAIVYLSMPWIVRVSTYGLVEGALACYLFLAVYAVVLWRGGDGSRLLLAGYLAGGAVSCKYPALLFVILPLAAWILLDTSGRIRGGPPRSSRRANGTVPLRRPSVSLLWKSLGVFLLAAAVGCGAWFAKNWGLTGNPTYPLLYSVLNGKTWTPEKDQQWNQVHRPHDFSPGRLAKDAVRVGLASEWLSPLIVPLAALVFLVPTNRRLSLWLWVYLIYVIAAWWLLTHRIDRFWIPVLPLAALLAGVGACWSREASWRRILIGLLVFGSLSNFIVATAGPGGYNRYFVSLRRLRRHPERVADPWHRYLNRHAQDGCVLMVGEAEVFDLEVPVLYSTCFDDSIFEQLVKGRTPEEAQAAMLARGITHVYVDWPEIWRYRAPGNYGFTDFVQPAVLERLVRAGVLEPLPPLEGHGGRAYRVRRPRGAAFY